MNYSYSKCLKIGEINRFNQKKEFSCAHYLNSEHQRTYNPGFNINDFCKYCKDHIEKELVNFDDGR